MQRDRRHDELASQRTLLAAERTFCAWVRTGLAAVGGGLAVARALGVSSSAPEVVARVIGALLDDDDAVGHRRTGVVDYAAMSGGCGLRKSAVPWLQQNRPGQA